MSRLLGLASLYKTQCSGPLAWRAATDSTSSATTPGGSLQAALMLLRRPAAMPLMVWCAVYSKSAASGVWQAADRLDLQDVQRIHEGQAVGQAARQRGLSASRSALPGDQGEGVAVRRHSARSGQRWFGQALVGHQRGVAGGNLQIALGQHLLHIGQRHLEKRRIAVQRAQAVAAGVAVFFT